jgi:hypothetical protein
MTGRNYLRWGNAGISPLRCASVEMTVWGSCALVEMTVWGSCALVEMTVWGRNRFGRDDGVEEMPLRSG